MASLAPYSSDDEYVSGDDDTGTDYSSDGEDDVYGSVGAPVKQSVPAQPPKNTGTTFETVESRTTSLFVINSRDRDTQVYPTPTFFTLRLPRVFKNIKRINISQINLLNSFFSFSASKGNTWLYVLEQGRTRIDPTTGNTVPNAIRIKINDGTYNTNELVEELNNALNSTPLFADIDFGSFVGSFQSSGDFRPLFNTPGPVVYNSLTASYERNRTINDIVARYFQQLQNVGAITYTYDQTLVAYYYPVIKEMIIESGTPTFGLGDQPIPAGFGSWYDYIVFAFQGLDDPVILQIVKVTGNIALFDTYRAQRTFNQFLVNKYVCTYNAKQGRLVINAPSLNDSIANDLNSKYTADLTELALSGGFTSLAAFNTAYASINNSNAALVEFYNFIQTRFMTNFGISYGKYGSDFYSSSNNRIELYNVRNAYGWDTSLTPATAESVIRSNAATASSPVLWNDITIRQTEADELTFISTLQLFPNNVAHFPNAGDAGAYGYVDVSCAMLPTTYIRTEFTAPCRQSIRIMTLPRYADDRGDATDIRYAFGPEPNQTPLLFDTQGNDTYIRTDISGNLLFNLYTVTQTMFQSAPYMRAYDEWLNSITPQVLNGTRLQPGNPNFGARPSAADITLASFRPFLFFQMNADEYLVEPQAHFRVRFFVETYDGRPFSVPLQISWYKNRAVFMADVAQDVLNATVGGESVRHYFRREIYAAGIPSAQMVVDVNNRQQTYFTVHVADNSAISSAIQLRVFATLEDAYGTYRGRTRIDNMELPVLNQSAIVHQSTPASLVYNTVPVKSIYNTEVLDLGYDALNVSNNLLDYTIQTVNNRYYDPTTITDYISGTNTGLQYQFELNTPGAAAPPPTTTDWSLFFDTTSKNIIRDTYSATQPVYISSGTQKSVSTNSHLLTNWFNPYNANVAECYLAPRSPVTTLNDSSVFLTCENQVRLVSDMSTIGTSVSGLCGMSFFLPPNAVARLDSVVIKFAYTQPSTDSTNEPFSRTRTPLTFMGQTITRNVHRNQTTYADTHISAEDEWDDWFADNRRNLKIGVFPTAQVHGAQAGSLRLSDALCTMTLDKITQVNNFRDQLGTNRTREPDWGTYYTYVFDPTTAKTLWDPAAATGTWRSTTVDADHAPTYIDADTSYPNFFRTHTDIYNYTYLPRSYGIAPSVGNAINHPDTLSTAIADLPNSYTLVPFYKDVASDTWTMGSFHGATLTTVPVMPSTGLAGAAPYYGPAGIWGFEQDATTGQIVIRNTDTPYYWNMKLAFDVKDIAYNPATDLVAFGGYTGIASEYQDTMLYVYKNTYTKQDLGAVSSVTQNGTAVWKWGQESGYIAHDDQNGYNYLSYIHDLPVERDGQYAVHARAYDPIAQFTTGLRIIGKNVTDFGTPSLWNIAEEISSLRGYTPISDISGSYYNDLLVNAGSASLYNSTISTNTSYRTSDVPFSVEYADALMRFNQSFSTTVTFGKKVGFSGVTYTFDGYRSTIATYVDSFSTIRSEYTKYNEIFQQATDRLYQYVSTRYANILPPTVANRTRFTDPIPFQFLFESKLEPPYTDMFDEWGLGYNLGFNKHDTTPPRTTITSDTFIRIVQDYIYLRLNPEFNINTLAVSGKENFACGKDTTSEDNKYFAKILLNNFGSYCRAAVQLPKDFNPVLGKYDTLSCQLVDRHGNEIANSDCEYDMVMEFTEITHVPKDSSSLVGPGTAAGV